MSLGLRILSSIVLLGAALAVQLSLNAAGSWRSEQHAEATLRLNAYGTHLLDAAGALAAERGLTNGALANPSAASAAVRDAITGQRGKVDTARAQALDGIAALSAAAGSRIVEAIPAERASVGHLDALRHHVDQAMQRQGTPPTQAEWFAGATAEVDAVTRLRRLIEAAGEQDPTVSRLIAVRDELAEMSEFGGRERGRINGAIAAGAHLSGADMAEIGLLRGRLEGAWSRIGTSGDFATPAVADALRDAGTAVFDTLQRTRRPVLEAAAAGAAWPVTPDAWFAASTRAIGSLLAAQARVGEAIDALLRQRVATSHIALLVALGLLVGAAAVVLTALWYVTRRVVRPLAGAVAALASLTAGELDVVVPIARGNDETAALLRATQQYQVTARAHRKLEADQEALRREADAGRTQAVRDIGALIEQESAQVVESVAQLAGRLRELSADVNTGAHTIADAATAACGAADQGLRDSDAAALGARELAASIAELTRQMDQAARATNAAVDRAAETRRSFDLLSSNVAAIDDVAKLIAEIASRTNLLALNATIEAARAGDAGKGFAVVASEVKQLAGQTARSTEQITSRVGAIGSATHEARQALVGIVGAVEDLERIATQVAAAIEQQSAATASIAGAVESTSLAARHTVERLGGVTQATDACTRTVGDMNAISQDVASRVLGLKVALAQLLHSRVVDLDRRTSARQPVHLTARLEHGGGVAEGTLLDISAGGARFVGAAPGMVRGTLKVTGLPQVAVRVASATDDGLHLAFEFASENKRGTMAAAVEQLADARVAA
jgi:methyl-accepting chemotaxis protein